MNPATNRLFVLFTALLLAARCAAAAQDCFSNPDPLKAFLHDKFANTNAGMVVGLLDEHGSRIFSAGKMDDGSDREVDGDTVFELGSVTKVFTSLLALDMARRGEMKLDDPVAKYLPSGVKVPAYEGKEITLRHLATQDSGLPWNSDDLDKILLREPKQLALKEFKEACDAWTAEDLYAFLARHTLTNAPGTKFQYSNVGMSLLGQECLQMMGGSVGTKVTFEVLDPQRKETKTLELTRQKFVTATE